MSRPWENDAKSSSTSMFKLMNLSPWTFAGLYCDWKWLHNDYKILWRGWRLKWKGFHCTTTLMEPFGTWYSNLLHAPHCVGCRGAEKAGGGMCAPCHLGAPGQVSDGYNGVMKRALLEEQGKASSHEGRLTLVWRMRRSLLIMVHGGLKGIPATGLAVRKDTMFKHRMYLVC